MIINRLFQFLLLFFIVSGCNTSTNKISDAQLTFHDTNQPALNYLNEAIQKNDNQPILYFQRSKVYYNLQQYFLALADINKAIQIDNLNSDYFYHLATVYRKLNKANLALNAAKKAEALNQPDGELILLIAQLYLDINDLNNAKKYYNIASQRTPHHADIDVIAGKIAFLNGDSTQAIILFKKALNKNPFQEQAIESLSNYYFAKQVDSSYYFVLLGLQKYAYNPYFQYQLGNILTLLNQNISANQAYETSLNIDSTYTPALYKVADANLAKHDTIKALNLLANALKYDKFNINANMKMAEILEKTGKERQAVAYYKTITMIEPEHPIAKNKYKELIEKYPTLTSASSTAIIEDTNTAVVESPTVEPSTIPTVPTATTEVGKEVKKEFTTAPKDSTKAVRKKKVIPATAIDISDLKPTEKPPLEIPEKPIISITPPPVFAPIPVDADTETDTKSKKAKKKQKKTNKDTIQ